MSRRALIQAEIDRRIRLKRQVGSARRLVLGIVAGGALIYSLGWFSAPRETREYQVVVTNPRSILQRKPPVVITRWRDRIRWREIEPVQVASGPGGAKGIVTDFCFEASRDPRLALIGDTTPAFSPTPSAELVLAASYSQPWFFGRGNLNVFGVRPNGDLTERIQKLGTPWQFHAGQAFSVRESRWWWVRDVVRIGVPLTVGFVAGRLTNEE